MIPPRAVTAWAVLAGPLLVAGNWLLTCASCVDQAYYGDPNLKENVVDADVVKLYAQLKRIQIREFDHRDDEFYNKFFPRRQLGLITTELKQVMPTAVAQLSERRWTNSKGTSNVTKNVEMLRDSHLLMVGLAATQMLARKAETLEGEMVDVMADQNESRRKREELLEQMVRVIAKAEVLQLVLARTEEGFVRLETDVGHFRSVQEARHSEMALALNQTRVRSEAQDQRIADFIQEFKDAVEREARADLVEKRKAAEADIEVAKVKLSIEELRWSEEQKTIQMREDEKRHSEEHSSKLHQDRVAHELAQKKAADLELLQSQEESNMRQQTVKVQGEKELLQLRLESEEKQAGLKLQEAIERSRIEQEAMIKERRDNEDIHLRSLRAEAQERRAQILAAIKAAADVAAMWLSSLYASPLNLLLGIGSVVACLGGIYVVREMAILLREQLNKRLGRPSLVRSTNRLSTLKVLSIGLLRLLRLIPPHGSEFNDVVLHPKLHQQIMRLAESTRSAKRRRMPLMHVMFYGPPGTGKTMVAQRFAEYSGLEYAIMSGGDVAPLQDQAVTELHKLFKWVHRSRRGVLLFIDEADAYLSSRKSGTMSEPLRNALTTMLYHTGTPSSQFMLVLATNRPGDLDSAVLDRIDESVEFGLPDLEARDGMVKLYFEKYIAKPLQLEILPPVQPPQAVEAAVPAETNRPLRKRLRMRKKKEVKPVVDREAWVDRAALSEVANRLHGFSGREISKLFTSLQTHVLYSDSRLESVDHLQKTLLFEVVDQKVLEHQRTADFQVSGYEYVHGESRPCSPKAAERADDPEATGAEPS